MAAVRERGLIFKGLALFQIPLTFVIGLSLGSIVAYFSGVHPSTVPLLAALIGLVVAFGVPFWQAYFINKPALTIDISSISRIISDDATISIQDDPELKVLGPSARRLSPYWMRDESLPFRRSATGESIESLATILDNAKRRLRDLPNQIENEKRSLGSGLIGHSQKMTVAASATAARKTVGHRS